MKLTKRQLAGMIEKVRRTDTNEVEAYSYVATEAGREAVK